MSRQPGNLRPGGRNTVMNIQKVLSLVWYLVVIGIHLSYFPPSIFAQNKSVTERSVHVQPGKYLAINFLSDWV